MRIRMILALGLLVLATACGTQNPMSASPTDAEAQQDGGYMGSGDRQ
jgi:hypothetical protein